VYLFVTYASFSLLLIFCFLQSSPVDIHFLCLGDWESHNSGDRYLALMDLREEPEARPKYRCGVRKRKRKRENHCKIK
jgi:hypothetical protein